MLSARFFFQWIIKYSNSGVFLSSALATLILFFRFYDAITDPICGYFSDRIKNKFTLINLSIPFFCLGLILCFYSTPSTQYKWLLEFLGMSLFFTGYSIYCIPYWSLISDYSEDNTTLSNLLGFGLLLATAISFIIGPLIVEHYGYMDAAIITASCSFILMYLPNFRPKVKPSKNIENIFKLSSQNYKLIFSGIFSEILSEIFSALKDKKFISASSIFVSSQMSLTTMTAAAPFLAIDLLGGKTTDVSLLLAPMIIVAIPSFLISQKLSKKWGWEKSVFTAATSLALLYFIMISIKASFNSYMLLFALSGMPIAILLGLEAKAVSEIAKDKISIYFGAINFLIKTGNGFALFITGIIAQASLNNSELILYMPTTASVFILLGLLTKIYISRTSIL